MRRTICLAAVALLTAGPALAHPGHEATGFLHPFTGLDHLLAMVGVGLWAALLAGRKPVIAVAVPGAFLAMMAIGAAAGFAGIKLPLVEAAILASVFVIGGLIIGAVRLPVAWAMAVVGLFAGDSIVLCSIDNCDSCFPFGFACAFGFNVGDNERGLCYRHSHKFY
jgi:urease accessory protein